MFRDLLIVSLLSLMLPRSLLVLLQLTGRRHRSPYLTRLSLGSRLTHISIMASPSLETSLHNTDFSSLEKSLHPLALPSLSAADFKIYNSMAEHMECFVSCFSSVSAEKC